MESELLKEGEMTVLIEHPEHGMTHVYTSAELEAHEALGWRKVESPAPVAPIGKPLLTLPKKVKT